MTIGPNGAPYRSFEVLSKHNSTQQGGEWFMYTVAITNNYVQEVTMNGEAPIAANGGTAQYTFGGNRQANS